MRRLIYTACALVMLTMLSAFAIAQDTAYARRIIADLSHPAFHGRGTSYRGDSLAAEYLRAELRRLGVQPLADNYWQDYCFSATSMEGACAMEVNGQLLQPFADYRVQAFSANIGTLTPRVVELPVTTLIDTALLRIFLKHERKGLAESFVYIDASKLDTYDESVRKCCNAELYALRKRNPLGSKGIIVGKNKLDTYSLGYTDKEHDYVYVEVLSSKMPKRVRSMRMTVHTQFYPEYHTQNVCGIIPGESDSMVVFTAHYDHCGMMGDSVYFPGAHDNASGCAAVLDLARQTMEESAAGNKPRYTIVVLFFSGEEVGLKGSRYATEHPVVDLAKIRLCVNIDMFCGGDDGLMVFNANADNTKALVDRMEMLNKKLELVKEIRRRDNSPNSDHYYFTPICPAIFVLSMGQPFGGYHDPYDTCERCGLEHYQHMLLLISTVAL